jgi:hypothetical protein
MSLRMDSVQTDYFARQMETQYLFLALVVNDVAFETAGTD